MIIYIENRVVIVGVSANTAKRETAKESAASVRAGVATKRDHPKSKKGSS